MVTGIAFVGTGFVADYYMTTLANHPALRLVGAFDRDAGQIERFARFYGVKAYGSIEDVLADPAVSILVNLTDPESHYGISRRALEAGRHVYSEKPLAMDAADAEALVMLAKERGLCLAAAPANALSPAHAATASLIAEGAIGTPRLVHVQMEDGPVFREKWREWRSRSGAPWPGEHEFEIGCTLEHAGYALTWLVSLFGPVESMTAFSALVFPDKGQPAGHTLGPDFSVGSLVFRGGVTARLTCGLAAPKDRSMTILGDKGTILVRDLWDHFSPVHVQRAGERRIVERVLARVERRLGATLPFRPAAGRRVRLPRTRPVLPAYPSKIDFCAGIDALAEAVARGRAPFFSGEVALHITELALALSNAGGGAGPYRPRSSFTPVPAAGRAPSR